MSALTPTTVQLDANQLPADQQLDDIQQVAIAPRQGGATMQVQLRESTTGSAWTSSDIVGGQGTGQVQFYPFQLIFNPTGSAIPAYGSYVGSFDVTLTATL